jgi:hypothetical protein
MDTIRNLKTPTENVLNNTYVSGFLKIIIILYATLAAPQLPPNISKYFHHPMVQIIIFALIAFTATKDIGISLLIAIAFFISFHSYTKNLISSVLSKTKSLFKRNLKEKYIAPAPVSLDDTLLDSSSSSSSINNSKVNPLLGVTPYNEEREMNSVQSGLLKDDASLKSDIEDAQLIDPYKSSMALVKDLSGFNL